MATCAAPRHRPRTDGQQTAVSDENGQLRADEADLMAVVDRPVEPAALPHASAAQAQAQAQGSTYASGGRCATSRDLGRHGAGLSVNVCSGAVAIVTVENLLHSPFGVVLGVC